MKDDNQLLEKLIKYICDTIGMQVAVDSIDHPEYLPSFLLDRYKFHQAFLDLASSKRKLLLCFSDERVMPTQIQKNFNHILKYFEMTPVYVSDTIDRFDRKELIQKHIPFIIPEKQLYLPNLGLDLREIYTIRATATQKYMPATQYLFLSLLNTPELENLTPTQIANKLGYTKMSMVRAFNELENTKIVTLSKAGKEKKMHTNNLTKRELWEKALPYLQSPVQKTLHLLRIYDMNILEKSFLTAGESALSHLTMLGEPLRPTYAIYNRLWSIMPKDEYEILPHQSDSTIQLQLWSYPPNPDTHANIVDNLSLYLTFKDDINERIQIEIESLLEGFNW
jgi:DNA-binding MarR family transcriptional regulator